MQTPRHTTEPMICWAHCHGPAVHKNLQTTTCIAHTVRQNHIRCRGDTHRKSA